MNLRLVVAALFLSSCAVRPLSAQDPVPPAGDSDAPKPARIRLGGNVAAAKVTHFVQPVYPPLARQTRISGTVRVHAILSKEGKVQSLDVVSGHPLLQQAALDAVGQWTYAPTLLNGAPVEVDTMINVVFALDGQAPKPDDRLGMDPTLRADILLLFRVTHFQENAVTSGREVFNSLRPAIESSLPATPSRDRIIDAYIDKLLALLQSDDYSERVIALYAKYFSDSDIQQLVQFYQTPIGQHFNSAMPQLFGEMNQLGQSMAMNNLPGIIKQLCKEFPELEDDARFCKEPDPQRKSQLGGTRDALRPSAP
jgi:TonB family protein